MRGRHCMQLKLSERTENLFKLQPGYSVHYSDHTTKCGCKSKLSWFTVAVSPHSSACYKNLHSADSHAIEIYRAAPSGSLVWIAFSYMLKFLFGWKRQNSPVCSSLKRSTRNEFCASSVDMPRGYCMIAVRKYSYRLSLLHMVRTMKWYPFRYFC